MASEIKAKYGTRTALTITLASLASSTSGLGRQTDIVDNSATRFQRVYVYYNIKLGTSPNSNAPITFYLIRDDGVTTIRTDGAGASDASLQVKEARPLEIGTTGGSAATGDVCKGDFVIENPGPKWGVAVVQGSGAALNGTGGNHEMAFLGENPEAQ